ncbi:MAG: hypothetical protein IAF00_03100 [Phycisphaerales bacterium]|nr:hypothetical protein [Phycisphaerales bacterium]
MHLSRRAVLIRLAASVPLASFLSSFPLTFASAAAATEGDSDILKVSRVIIGRDDLNPAIAQRVFDALVTRIDGFKEKLSALASALGGGKDRDAALSALDDDNLELALAIAQPWYTGVAGVGSEHSYDDGAIFVTFLGAEAFRAIQHIVPIQSYSTGAPGWWADTPAGMTAPPMPEQIRDWAYVPPGADGPTVKADPEFLTLVMSQKSQKMK